MLVKIVHLNSFLKLKSLSTRSLAERVFEEAVASKAYFVLLSFKNIDFASRSFFNELNFLRGETKTKKIIYFSMSQNLKSMEKISRHNVKTKIPEKDISVISIDTL